MDLMEKLDSRKNLALGTIYKQRRHFFRIFDTPLPYVGQFFITVKLGNKECFDKKQIGVKEPFAMTKWQFTTSKDKEHLALRNNFRMIKKFLITKLDCTIGRQF